MAQATANIAVTATGPTKPVKTSSSMAVKVSIKNNGPSNATGVHVDATFDATVVKVSSVSGCTPVDTTGAVKLPCVVDDQGLGAGLVPQDATAALTITFALTKDKAAAIVAGPCPVGSPSLGDVTVTATATTTPTSASSGPVHLPGIAEFADVGIDYVAVDKDGKPLSTANEGDTVTFNATVTNAGPCVAPDVVASTATTMMTWVSGTQPCPGDAKDSDCDIGTMQVGDKVTFSRQYKIDPPPGKDAAEGAYAHFSEIDVASNDVTDNSTPPKLIAAATWDPNGDNDGARPIVTSNHAASGCGTGGRGVDVAALAVLPVLLLLARAQRRRAAVKQS